MTADIYSYTFKYFYSGLPVSFRESFRITSRTRAFELPADGSADGPADGGTFTADAAAYELLTALAYRGPHIVESDSRAAKAGIDQFH